MLVKIIKRSIRSRIGEYQSVGNVIDERLTIVLPYAYARDHRYIGQPVNIEKWGNFASEIGARVHGTRGGGRGRWRGEGRRRRIS